MKVSERLQRHELDAGQHHYWHKLEMIFKFVDSWKTNKSTLQSQRFTLVLWYALVIATECVFITISDFVRYEFIFRKTDCFINANRIFRPFLVPFKLKELVPNYLGPPVNWNTFTRRIILVFANIPVYLLNVLCLAWLEVLVERWTPAHNYFSPWSLAYWVKRYGSSW